MIRKVFVFLALALALGGCQAAPVQPQPATAAPPPYLTEAEGGVTLHLSALLEEGMAVQLKRGGEADENAEPAGGEVLLDKEQTRSLFAALDAAAYGSNPQPMPTGAKGYLWAVRVADESTDTPLLFFFLDMETRVTLVVLDDGSQRSFSLTQEQGQALDKAFAAIAAQAGMEEKS